MRGYVALALAVLAAATPAWAQEPAQAMAARVAGSAVEHPGEGVTVRVPSAASYVGGERFTLYGVADCEIHVFIDAGPDRRMNRLWWIQFESYLPDKPDLSYDYAEGNSRMMLGGTPTWVRANPVPTTGPMREGSDREAVFRILQKGGYPIPPEVMNVRMVQLLDDAKGSGQGRRELMIIYSENLAPTGRTLADLTTDGKPDRRWAPMGKAMIGRAMESVKVERR
jgi:hypothetical protein